MRSFREYEAFMDFKLPLECESPTGLKPVLGCEGSVKKGIGGKKLVAYFYDSIVPDQRYLAYLEGIKVTLLISFFAIIIGILIGIIVVFF